MQETYQSIQFDESPRAGDLARIPEERLRLGGVICRAATMGPEIFAGLNSDRHKSGRIQTTPVARLTASVCFCKVEATNEWTICDDAAASRILIAGLLISVVFLEA